jgi:hypothetical protein
LFVCEACIAEGQLSIPDVHFLFAASKDKVPEQKIIEMATFLVDVHITRVTSAACPLDLDQEMWAYVWKLFNKVNSTAQYGLMLQADRDNTAAVSRAHNDTDLPATQAADLKRFRDAQKAVLAIYNTQKTEAEWATAKASKAYEAYLASEVRRTTPKTKVAGKIRKGAAAAAADSDDDSDDSLTAARQAKKPRRPVPALIFDEGQLAAAEARAAAAEARAATAEARAAATRVSLDLTED